MKLILTDIDDTVLKFGDKFQSWCVSKGLPTFGNLRDLCSIEEFLQIEREIATDLVIEFSSSPDQMPFLEPEECALEFVPKLYAEGWQFTAISSCLDTPEVVVWRRENLERVFGIPFVDVHCTGLLKPKHDYLSRYDSTVWVEDNAFHATVGAGMGHRTFLLDRQYNRPGQIHPGAGLTGENVPKRVKDWGAIYNAISGT
jgi:hypothetical protein